MQSPNNDRMFGNRKSFKNCNSPRRLHSKRLREEHDVTETGMEQATVQAKMYYWE